MAHIRELFGRTRHVGDGLAGPVVPERIGHTGKARFRTRTILDSPPKLPEKHLPIFLQVIEYGDPLLYYCGADRAEIGRFHLSEVRRFLSNRLANARLQLHSSATRQRP